MKMCVNLDVQWAPQLKITESALTVIHHAQRARQAQVRAQAAMVTTIYITLNV